MTARLAARRGATLLALAGALSLGGCVRSTSAGGPESVAISFENQSLEQADVFAVSRGTGARKLGTVFSGRTEALTLPGELARRGDIALVARLLSGYTVGSGVLGVGPGGSVKVTLPLDRKTLVVLPNP
jgi:hypothetical protein